MEEYSDVYMEPSHTISLNQIRSALFGLAVGDALGVPVEFMNREALKRNPVTDMSGYGMYNLPAGTWSDDSSLSFCLAEALTEDFDMGRIARKFVKWKDKSYWTPRGSVFDIGITTNRSINRLKRGISPELTGGSTEDSNGNGSLMRILPLLFHIKDMPLNERFELTRLVSSITHSHIRSVIACFYYLEFARLLIHPSDKLEVYKTLRREFIGNLDSLGINPEAFEPFDKLLTDDIFAFNEEEIGSSGYVVETLEASTWCLMTTDSYSAAVLKAVNLGGDTDTTSAVTGGLAGLLYGYDQIPKRWIDVLARKNDIEDLCRRLANRLQANGIDHPGLQ